MQQLYHVDQFGEPVIVFLDRAPDHFETSHSHDSLAIFASDLKVLAYLYSEATITCEIRLAAYETVPAGFERQKSRVFEVDEHRIVQF